jgi:hypothetical protein
VQIPGNFTEEIWSIGFLKKLYRKFPLNFPQTLINLKNPLAVVTKKMPQFLAIQAAQQLQARKML